MVVAIISIVLVILNMYFKKNKFLYCVLFMWMWIIMAFTSGIADEGLYINRYSHPENWIGSSEIIYSATISIGNKLGMSFGQFKAAISCIQLLLIFSTIWKLAEYPNLVSTLFLIYPFALNVAQMRNTLATAVLIFAIRYLFDDGLKVKQRGLTSNDIKYVIAILIATYIHSASLIWLILVLAKKCSLQMSVFLTISCNILIFFVLSPNNIVHILNLFGAGNRMAAYFSMEYQASNWRHYGMALIRVTFTAGGLIGLCLYINRKRQFNYNEQVQFLLKVNILILCIYGLIFKYTSEVYRLQEGLTVLNLIIITNAFKPEYFKGLRLSVNNARAFLLLLSFICAISYIALGIYLVPTIVIPILKNNSLINFLLS